MQSDSIPLHTVCGDRYSACDTGHVCGVCVNTWASVKMVAMLPEGSEVASRAQWFLSECLHTLCVEVHVGVGGSAHCNVCALEMEQQ